MVAKELLRVEDLYVMYKTDMEEVHAVNGIALPSGSRKPLGLWVKPGRARLPPHLQF